MVTARGGRHLGPRARDFFLFFSSRRLSTTPFSSCVLCPQLAVIELTPRSISGSAIGRPRVADQRSMIALRVGEKSCPCLGDPREARDIELGSVRDSPRKRVTLSSTSKRRRRSEFFGCNVNRFLEYADIFTLAGERERYQKYTRNAEKGFTQIRLPAGQNSARCLMLRQIGTPLSFLSTVCSRTHAHMDMVHGFLHIQTVTTNLRRLASIL